MKPHTATINIDFEFEYSYTSYTWIVTLKDYDIAACGDTKENAKYALERQLEAEIRNGLQTIAPKPLK